MKKVVIFTLLTLGITLSTASTHAQTTISTFGERIFYYSTLKSNVADFIAHEKDIDIIAPQTYEVTYNLNASGTVPVDLAQAAQADHVKIMPLIANHNFSQNIIHNLLTSSVAENALITFLVSEAQTKGYIGWQFDFEHIASSDRDLFSAFTSKTAAALHAHGLILSVAVVAQSPGQESADPKSGFYKNWSGAYDYASLASSTDFLSLMTYDDPDSKGASAPLPFVKSVLNNILSQVPPFKNIPWHSSLLLWLEYREPAGATEFRRHLRGGNAKGKGLPIIPRIQFFRRSSLDNLQARSKNLYDMV
jgi:spore germination protein YaaH